MRSDVNQARSIRRESTTDATRPCDLTGKNPHDPQGHWRVRAPIRTSLALRFAKQTTGLRTHVCAEKCTQQSISCANGSNFRERKFEGFSQESLHKKTRTADAVLVFWSGLRGEQAETINNCLCDAKSTKQGALGGSRRPTRGDYAT